MSEWLRVAGIVTRNDLRREVRSGQSWITMLLFALIVVVVFGFIWGDLKGPRQEVLVAGVLWVTIPFASLVAYGRSFAAEREEDRLLGLALAPVDRSAIYAGKFLANLLLILGLEAVFLPLAALFLGITEQLAPVVAPLALVLLLGSAGLSAIGTLLAAMVVQLRQGDALLAVLLLPIAIPVVACAVESTAILLVGDPLRDARTFLLLNLVFDLIVLGIAGMVFDNLMED